MVIIVVIIYIYNIYIWWIYGEYYDGDYTIYPLVNKHDDPAK